jgi:small subunit ribosomal protein S5
MSEEKATQNENKEAVIATEKPVESNSDSKITTPADKTSATTPSARPAQRRGGAGAASGGQRFFKKNKRTSKRRERVKSEFDQKILNIRRVTRVASGGRRFSFSVSIVIGDKKGKVGVGIGKAGDTSLAIDKAAKNAKKNMVTIKRTDEHTIAHDVKAKYNSARIMLMPAKGRGMIAGSAVRDVLLLAGVTDINTKIISGSKNKINIARATVKALGDLKN